MRSKTSLVLSIILLTAIAGAADPIRYYRLPDGRIRLWLRGAPTVTATNAGGWRIDPTGKEKDRTWLDRIKGFVATGDSSPWHALLSGLSAGHELPGVYSLKPKLTLYITGDPDRGVTVRTSSVAGGTKSVQIGTDGLAVEPQDDGAMIDFVASAAGAVRETVVSALRHVVGDTAGKTKAPFGPFVIASLRTGPQAPPLILDTGNGPAIVALDVKPTAPAALPPAKPAATGRPSVEQVGMQIPSALIATGVAGLAVGFFTGWMLRPRPKTPPEKPAPSPRASVPGPVKPAGADAAWSKERDQTLRALEEERAAHRRLQAEADASAARLRQAQDEATRTKQELARQIEGLQRSGQSAQAETRSLLARSDAYAQLQQGIAEAMTFLQAEIGRPETSAAVGYLLACSCATLLQTVTVPKPALERAMLANIERIAAQFPTSPHARKLAGEAKRLAAPLGAGPIPESTQSHAQARQFDEILRLLRNQRNLELSPFYFGVDESGAAHAVYV